MSDLRGLDAAVRELVDEMIASRVDEAVERALERREQLERSPFMTPAEAMEYLRCKRHRIDGLIAQGKLFPPPQGRRRSRQPPLGQDAAAPRRDRGAAVGAEMSRLDRTRGADA